MSGSAAAHHEPAPSRRFAVIAPVHPLTAGAAHFNGELVAALRRLVGVQLIGWRRLYPPVLYRGQERDASSAPVVERPSLLIDWHDPRSWRAALNRVEEAGAEALILPWLHPVMTPPYRWLLRHAPAGVQRVVICHNVTPHEPFRGAGLLTKGTLRHADLLVTHAPHQREELAALGLDDIPVLQAFHPRFTASAFAPAPSLAEVAAERLRQGSPDLLLLCFGSVRPYKGVDLALDALARVDPDLRVRLVVAGRFWSELEPFQHRVRELGLARKVELRDGYVPNDEAALLFTAADAALLPYRSASQSGVAQLAFAYGCPVIATAVGGLPAAIDHGTDGLLCPPDDPVALARAIERMALEQAGFADAIRQQSSSHSFDRYAELVADTLQLPEVRG